MLHSYTDRLTYSRKNSKSGSISLRPFEFICIRYSEFLIIF